MVDKPTQTDSNPSKPEGGTEEVKEQTEIQQEQKTEVKPEELVLQKIKEITGREFKSLDEAKTHYKNLESFVGQNPEEYKAKAQLMDKVLSKWQEAGWSKEEAEAELRKTVEGFGGIQQTTETAQNPLIDKEIAKLKKDQQKIQRELDAKNILEQHPNMKPFIDEIKTLAETKGKSVPKAFTEDFLPLYEKFSLVANQSQRVKETTQISPSETITPPTKQVDQFFQQAVKSGKEEDWNKYIAEKFKRVNE